MNVNKLRKKYNHARILKTISYLLGFPLLILLTFIGSMPFFKGDGFADTKLYGIIIAAVLWLVLIVIQIIVSLLTKSYNARTLCVVLFTIILVIGGSAYFDYFYANKKIEDLQEKYSANSGVVIQDYNRMVNTFNGFIFEDLSALSGTLTKKYNDEVLRFTTVYNIAFKSKVFGSANSDGSEYTYDAEADVYLSENGLLADGYVFGVQEAVRILIDYHTMPIRYFISNPSLKSSVTSAVTKIQGYSATGVQKAEIDMFLAMDADAPVFPTPSSTLAQALNEAMAKAYKDALKKVDSSADWRAYIRSDEYLDAYGTDGSAWAFMFNEERLNALLATLGAGLSDFIEHTKKGLAGVGIDLIEMLNDALGTSLTPSTIKNLDLDDLIDIVDSLELDLSDFGIEGELDKEAVFDLLEAFVFYQSPTVRPQFDFIEDEYIRAYAYAEYYGKTHGGNMGSVLIGDNIGKVTMDATGYEAKYGFNLTQLYQIEADMSYAPDLFPLFALRRYTYACGGLIAISFIFFYKNKKKEDDIFAQIARGGY